MKAKHKQAGRFPYAVKWAEKLFEQGDPSERKEKTQLIWPTSLLVNDMEQQLEDKVNRGKEKLVCL